METITPPRKTLMPIFPRHEPVVHDPTARVAAKKCFRYYFLKIVLGFRPKHKNGLAINYPLGFGSCYHKFREVLTKKRSENNHLELAISASMKKWPDDPPVGSRYEFLTQARLMKSCLVAYDRVKKEEEAGHIKVIQPEQPFDILMKDNKTRCGGRLDEGVRWNGKPWVRDFKSSSKTLNYWNRKLEPNDQFTCYTYGYSKMCGEIVQGTIVELLLNNRKEGPKITPLTSTRTPGQLDKWEDDNIFFMSLVAQCREADVWPMEESECTHCEFRDVCKMPSESAMIDKLQTNYDQKPWDFKTLGESDDD